MGLAIADSRQQTSCQPWNLWHSYFVSSLKKKTSYSHKLTILAEDSGLSYTISLHPAQTGWDSSVCPHHKKKKSAWRWDNSIFPPQLGGILQFHHRFWVSEYGFPPPQKRGWKKKRGLGRAPSTLDLVSTFSWPVYAISDGGSGGGQFISQAHEYLTDHSTNFRSHGRSTQPKRHIKVDKHIASATAYDHK